MKKYLRGDVFEVNLPDGFGAILINGLQKIDVPVIQGLTVIYALLGMISFLLGDIITVFFDPRIKLTED